MSKEDKYYTELDRQLREMAINDWVTFFNLIGEDAIEAAKICMLRKQNKSLGQIEITLNIKKKRAEYINNSKCKCSSTTKPQNYKVGVPKSGIEPPPACL